MVVETRVLASCPWMSSTFGTSDPLWGRIGGTGHVTWQVDTSATDLHDNETTLAHEIGHNLGLRHTDRRRGPAPAAASPPRGCNAVDESKENTWPYPDRIRRSGLGGRIQSWYRRELFDVLSASEPSGCRAATNE